MNILRDLAACPARCQGAAVALGNFDGVHLGHQEILRLTAGIAKADNIPAAALTFEPHPREFFAKTPTPLRICSFRRKAELLAAAGMQTLFLARFNKAFASLSADAFVEEILHRQLHVRHVVTGYNFAFGHNREGSTEFLAAEARRLGFGFTACPPVREGDDTISSSTVRALLAEGQVRQAALLLGHPYRIEGRVRRGHQRGRDLGFPTANLALGKLFRPRFGVYAVRMAVGKEKQWHKAVASIGVNPTFGAQEPVLEVHGFDMQRDLYGQCVCVEFADFIRDEKRFDSPELLRKQMEDDTLRAKKLLAVD